MAHVFFRTMELREIQKEDASHPKLVYAYRAESHYALKVSRRKHGWSVHLELERLPAPIEKRSEGALFAPHIDEPRAFVARVGGEEAGWLELGYDSWNNRARIWELIVLEQFRGQGVGRALIDKAIDIARARGARMLVLETQSCNVSAIGFYLSKGFTLIGFDSAAYTNEDVERGEVRLELGMGLT